MKAAALLLFALLVAHALCDYPLQGDFLARAKRRGGIPGVPWYHALTSHALIHAGAVWMLTAEPILGLAELAAHWAIDYWKCEDAEFGSVTQARRFDVDQALHVGCKLLWVVLVRRWL
jgi:hypothetical protein